MSDLMYSKISGIYVLRISHYTRGVLEIRTGTSTPLLVSSSLFVEDPSSSTAATAISYNLYQEGIATTSSPAYLLCWR